MRKRIAIIGASTGQLPLCLKAKEMGLETYCFAWPEGAVCKEYVNHFIPISIFEMDEIVRLCKEADVDGVVSNASEATALVVSYVAEKIGKVCVPYDTFKNIQNKEWVRQQTNTISGLTPVKYIVGSFEDIFSAFPRPYVLKPIKGAAKKGVNFVDESVTELTIPNDLQATTFMAEMYVSGKEFSVESMSYENQHQVVQITEKISTSAPHFVELEHHQPAPVSSRVREKIQTVVPRILSSVGFVNGASHIEIKVDEQENIYLIEINPRGGGDYISNNLISLSTDYDYLQQLLLVSLGIYKPMPVHTIASAGIYFLSAFTSRLLPYFDAPKAEWMVMRERAEGELTYSCSNYDRNGFILYCSKNKIVL